LQDGPDPVLGSNSQQYSVQLTGWFTKNCPALETKIDKPCHFSGNPDLNRMSTGTWGHECPLKIEAFSNPGAAK
jgi:hypothetical protein